MISARSICSFLDPSPMPFYSVKRYYSEMALESMALTTELAKSSFSILSSIEEIRYRAVSEDDLLNSFQDNFDIYDTIYEPCGLPPMMSTILEIDNIWNPAPTPPEVDYTPTRFCNIADFENKTFSCTPRRVMSCPRPKGIFSLPAADVYNPFDVDSDFTSTTFPREQTMVKKNAEKPKKGFAFRKIASSLFRKAFKTFRWRRSKTQKKNTVEVGTTKMAQLESPSQEWNMSNRKVVREMKREIRMPRRLLPATPNEQATNRSSCSTTLPRGMGANLVAQVQEERQELRVTIDEYKRGLLYQSRKEYARALFHYDKAMRYGGNCGYIWLRCAECIMSVENRPNTIMMCPFSTAELDCLRRTAQANLDGEPIRYSLDVGITVYFAVNCIGFANPLFVSYSAPEDIVGHTYALLFNGYLQIYLGQSRDIYFNISSAAEEVLSVVSTGANPLLLDAHYFALMLKLDVTLIGDYCQKATACLRGFLDAFQFTTVHDGEIQTCYDGILHLINFCEYVEAKEHFWRTARRKVTLELLALGIYIHVQLDQYQFLYRRFRDICLINKRYTWLGGPPEREFCLGIDEHSLFEGSNVTASSSASSSTTS